MSPVLVAETDAGVVELGPALSIFDPVHVGIDEFGHPKRVPLIELGGFAFTLAEVVLLGATAYYLTLDVALALMMLGASILLAAAGRALPMSAAVVLFVLGWVFQFVGHYVYEKKSPAFYRNFAHLLVGPLWILAKVSGRA